MKGLIFLITLIFIYYQINKRFPENLSTKTHIYFAIFVILFATFCYMMNYQSQLVYKVMKNIKDVNEKPLYDMDSFIYKENQMVGLKSNLAMRQGWRCINCQNPLLQKDMHEYSIDYIKPLQFGGENNINNMGIHCTSCSSFKPY